MNKHNHKSRRASNKSRRASNKSRRASKKSNKSMKKSRKLKGGSYKMVKGFSFDDLVINDNNSSELKTIKGFSIKNTYNKI